MTIDGGNSFSIDRGLTIDATGYDVTLDGMSSGGSLLSISGNTQTVTLRGLHLFNAGGEGQAMGFNGPGPVTIENSTFSNLSAFFNPVILTSVDLTLIGNTFTNIETTDSVIANRSGGTLTVINSTFSGFENVYELINNEAGSVVTISHSTIVDYSSQYGSALANNGQMTVANSIIVGNSATDCTGTISDGGYNIVQNGGGCPNRFQAQRNRLTRQICSQHYWPY